MGSKVCVIQSEDGASLHRAYSVFEVTSLNVCDSHAVRIVLASSNKCNCTKVYICQPSATYHNVLTITNSRRFVRI